MCYPVCGMVHIKEPLLRIEKSSPCGGFLSRYPNGPLPYVRRHITVNKNVSSASLNKRFPISHKVVAAGFPFLLSEWSLTIHPTFHNRERDVANLQ